MRFLANENFPYPSILLLRNSGFEVVSIMEEMSGIRDEEVLEKAVKEQLIILTFDRDYGELLFKYRKNPPPAVVYFRTKGQTPEDAGLILLSKITSGISFNNHFTVIEETGVRQRKLA
jgi:predicted nuclease of predicted toxin-antitoxin system